MTDLDNAVLRALKARGIRVKPLEWEDQPGGSYCWTQGLHYYTEGSDAERDWYVSCMIYDDDVWQGANQSTRAAAKAAAQADYAARILAALEDTGEPALIREAEARVARIAAGLFPGGYYKNLEAIEAAALRKDEEPK